MQFTLSRNTLRLVSMFLVLVLLVPACASGSQSSTIRVGSKDFTEEFILGEMYAQALENAGYKVERKLNLGGTPVAQQALLNNEIDLYPEYTGTGLETVLKLPASSNREQVYQTVAQEYKKQFNLIWLQPSPMSDTQALAMTQEELKKFGITTISEMAAKANQLVMVGPPEFQEREDGLPGLKKVYGDFTLKEYKAVDPGLRYQALLQGQADVAVAFSTDGEVAADNLVLLKDDKHMFPPYQVAPVIREDTLNANPGIAEILNTVTAQITDPVMQKLNYEVTGNKREPAAVAKEFLKQQGLIK